MAERYLIAGLAVGLLGTTACTAILGLDDKPLATSGADEAGASDAGVDGKKDDAKSDAPTHVDAAKTCTADDAGYHDPSNAACWEVHPVSASFDEYASYAGAAFDGRYAYFVSDENGLVVRYDTHASFTDSTGWSEFSTLMFQNGNSGGYGGVVFDGRYMYFVPADGPFFLRYDTTKDFLDASNWEVHASTASPQIDYEGGAFDGRYIYFAPYQDSDGNDSGLVARYDTKAGSFTADTSWSTFDLSTVGDAMYRGSAQDFHGVLFDGSHIYLVPTGVIANVIARYDVSSSFTSASSWELFDTGNVNDTVLGYCSGAFDGTYAYFAPLYASAPVIRFDISKSFTATASWEQYVSGPAQGVPGNSLASGFSGASYDGRNFYFVPNLNLDEHGDGFFVRYDDGASAFTKASSWSTYDTTTFHANDFGATVFDGRYLYLAPGGGTPSFARFDTKDTTTPLTLAGYQGGSFF